MALAYRDGVVTEREREDLDLVSEALGVDGVHQALARATAAGTNGHAGAGQLKGRTVCFTGTLLCKLDGALITRERAQALAAEAGMTVAERVTRGLDVLVVADPHSLSGKAQKARDYRTRIVAETAFWPMIGVDAS